MTDKEKIKKLLRVSKDEETSKKIKEFLRTLGTLKNEEILDCLEIISKVKKNSHISKGEEISKLSKKTIKRILHTLKNEEISKKMLKSLFSQLLPDKQHLIDEQPLDYQKRLRQGTIEALELSLKGDLELDILNFFLLNVTLNTENFERTKGYTANDIDKVVEKIKFINDNLGLYNDFFLLTFKDIIRYTEQALKEADLRMAKKTTTLNFF